MGILENHGGNMGEMPILYEACQIGAQIFFSAAEAQLAPDVVPVIIDGAGRHPQYFVDFLGPFTVPDEIGHLDFGVGQFVILQRLLR